MQYIMGRCKALYRVDTYYSSLEASCEHKPVTYSNNNDESDNGCGDTASEEVLDVEIALSGSLIFHHDGSCRMLEECRRQRARNLLMLGKPLVGRPIAPLAMRTAPMTSRLGCGSGMF